MGIAKDEIKSLFQVVWLFINKINLKILESVLIIMFRNFAELNLKIEI